MRALLLSAVAVLAVLRQPEPVRAQELQLFAPEHEARFAPGSDEPMPSPALARALDQAMAAFANRGDVKLVLVGAPEDALFEARARRLLQSAPNRAAWPAAAARGVARARDSRVAPDRLRVALRFEAAAQPACAAWEAEAALPQFFGGRMVKIPLAARIALPAGTELVARRRPAAAGGLGPLALQGLFSPPARLSLTEQGGRLLEGQLIAGSASRMPGDKVGSYHMLPPPEPASQSSAFSAPASAGSGSRSLAAAACEVAFDLR